MPNYSVKQIVYQGRDSCVTPIDIEIKDIQGSASTGDNYRAAPYQQIVIRPVVDAQAPIPEPRPFDINETYFLSLTIPKNQNYDLQYAIRLIEYKESGDLDDINYQFIRYITSHKISEDDSDSSRVVLFQEKGKEDDFPGERAPVYVGDIKIAIAEVIPYDTPDEDLLLQGQHPYSYQAQTMYYHPRKELYYWCTDPNSPWPYIYQNDLYKLRSSTDLDWSMNVTAGGRTIEWKAIGKNDILLSHSWRIAESESTDTFNIIFKPRVPDLTAIYLHLIPKEEDNDIQWQVEQEGKTATYYGRHIDVDFIQDKIKLYQMRDLLDVTARRIGIWGHPGLMFHLEGEEIKIGPSGYYELHDFTVNELGVAAFGPEDKFTIDVQYS